MEAQRIIYTALFCTIIVILIHCVIHFKIIRKVSSWYTLRLVSSLFIILLIHSKFVQSIALLFSRAVFNMNPGEKYSFSLWNHEPSDVFEITNHKTARCGWLLDAASLRCRTQQESSVLLSIFFPLYNYFLSLGTSPQTSDSPHTARARHSLVCVYQTTTVSLVKGPETTDLFTAVVRRNI